MKQTSTIETSAISDDAPKLLQADFDRASFRVGGKPASKAEWQDAMRFRLGKARVNIMLDVPIIEHFKTLSGGRGYQTLINDALKKVIEAGKIEADLRKVIREELHCA